MKDVELNRKSGVSGMHGVKSMFSQNVGRKCFLLIFILLHIARPCFLNGPRSKNESRTGNSIQNE
jgi:hypothetical protein